MPVIVVHLSSALGYAEVCYARSRGVKVYVETCSQYLLLDDSVYTREGVEGAKFVCSPPLRNKADCDILWNALACGKIDTVSTDHCSFTTKQKQMGQNNFTEIPGGLPGVETRAMLMFSEGVETNRISAEQMCALLSENPAKLYGMYPQKGSILPGSDADLVIIDPRGQTRISASDSVSNSDYSPYEGLRLSGRIVSVMLRGKSAVMHGKVLLNPGEGRFIQRGRNTL